MMRVPTVRGTIRRRLLVNFRADPEVVQRILPAPFRPKLHAGCALVGICLIRLEGIRPIGFPPALGITSENAAHRIAVRWTEDDGSEREGVYIPRRDTSSLLNRMVGGRIFPGEHHGASFTIRDDGDQIDFSMNSHDGTVAVRVVARNAERLPDGSIFKSLDEASAFFEGGSLGYSVTRNSTRLDGLRLQTNGWRVRALDVSEVRTSYFDDRTRFPEGTIAFDHTLVMRDIAHEWHQAADLHTS